MRKTIGIFVITLSLLALAAGAFAEPQTFGEGVSSHKTMLVSELLANPDEYVGKTVRVQGTAVGVCSHRGCWVNIASDKEGDVVRVKVVDGVIVFPKELMGETIIAEGVWTANKLDMETTKKVCEHRAKQAGEEFDPATVTECMTHYQISGTGAVVVKETAVEKSKKG